MSDTLQKNQGSLEAEEDTIDLAALIGTLWRGKWLIAFVTICVMGLAIYYAYFKAVPMYRSTAVVILDTKQDNFAGLPSIAGGLSGDNAEVNTEVEVLRSRGLAEKVVERLNLIEDPEFNSELREPSLIGRGIKAVKSVFGSGMSEEMAQSETLQENRIRDNVTEQLLRQVSVGNIRQSLVFNISAETQSPVKSAKIADTFAETYIRNQLEVKFTATDQATEWLSNRVSELQIELETAEKKVKSFTAQTQLVSIEGLEALERQIKDMRDRISNAEISKIELETTLSALNNAQTTEEKLAAAKDATLTRIARDGLTSEASENAFNARYQTILDRVRVDTARAEQQLTTLRLSEVELGRQVASQGEDLIVLQQLTRESEATRLLYEYFLTRLKETSAQEGIQKADSRILSHAVVPAVPSAPKKTQIVALAMILGAMIGAGIVLLREYRMSTFRTADELESHTGINVLGQVPLIPTRARQDTLQYLSDKPTSAAAEAIRNLRTSLMLSNMDKKPQVIVSTSSIPGEGKTTVSLSLAKFLSGLGKSVLLIEGDIRRRTLNEYFPTLPTTGIASVLNQDVDFADAIHRPKGFDVDVLAGEKTNVNAADIFSSDTFKAFIAEMRKRYDFIIIDTPPILVVPDARIISESADAILFSVKWDSTSRALLDESMRMFQNSNQRITGFVLSQIDEKRMRKYGYGDKGGAYSQYGKGYYDI
ncbi:polysaccharide biosynthesis tyrosine autokinase [uncultured Sulfitobacter sp.]|uniref:polysaccharide biosynthesis tyrosine autokinase n=1 Tax=uncultured Sulfitobacter sp. TaxID=191468 RepID=UPI0030F54FCD